MKAPRIQASIRKTGVVRFGVVGVGFMGLNHCNGIRSVAGARLSAVCDGDAARAGRVAAKFKVAPFASHKDLIRSGACDAVCIATPHPLHPGPAVDCMNAGLHVITEKPLSECVSTAERMIRAAEKNRVAFAVMFQRRFEPAMLKAVEIARSGALGRIRRTLMVAPEYRSQAYYDSGKWRATWKGEGGGVMINQAPHVMDLFILLGGMPCEVYGRTETRMHKIEVEDLAEAMLKYPGGGTGYFHCSTCEPAPGQMIEIFGDKGKLVFRDGALKLFRYDPPVNVHNRINREPGTLAAPRLIEQKIRVEQRETDHAQVIENMTLHLLKGVPLLSAGATGLASLELANAVTLSSHLGRPVKIPISRRMYDRFLADRRKTASGA
ncbi:MAG: Gfo/Idh/MocA family oxidoreductase [Lentisphaerae bacterium]|nr:Gfo/Idh/MocA family oxidoreductase [Lentisphaerota bacterium]